MTGFVSGNGAAFAGITSAFSYNKRLQPVNMSATAPSQTVFSIGYDFHVGNGTTGSDNGNVWNIYNYRDRTRDQSFNYDTLNRLISAQNAGTDCTAATVNGKTEYWGNSYGYDAWGNLTDKTVTKCGAETFHPGAASVQNQLTGYGYDAAGNMISDPTDSVTSTYDAENRIATASTPLGVFTYTYDADGNRVEKSGGGTGTLYWYMTPGIIGESDLSGVMKSEYVFFNGERVARRDFDPTTGTPTGVFYYFSDHLKTASIVTDSAGNIKSESDYYPWGGELQFVNNDSNHYKFTGKERDAESGLDYFGARYYSNGLGRFISADPLLMNPLRIVNPQRLNLYAYTVNSPTTLIDPDGRDAIAVNFTTEVPVGGHQGIIVVHADGTATYARFGPKGGNAAAGPGEVQLKSLTPVKFQSNGLPTDGSYSELVKEVADFEGKQPVSSVGLNYFKTSETDAAALDAWMHQLKALSDAGHAPDYQVNTQNCATFCIAGLLRANAIQNKNISIIPDRLFVLLSSHATENYSNGNRTPKEKVTSKIHYCTATDKSPGC